MCKTHAVPQEFPVGNKKRTHYVISICLNKSGFASFVNNVRISVRKNAKARHFRRNKRKHPAKSALPTLFKQPDISSDELQNLIFALEPGHDLRGIPFPEFLHRQVRADDGFLSFDEARVDELIERADREGRRHLRPQIVENQ